VGKCYGCEGQFTEGVEGVKDFSFVSDILYDEREVKKLMLSGKFSDEKREPVALCHRCAVQAIVSFAKELQESFLESDSRERG
jgi:hypothetical protein